MSVATELNRIIGAKADIKTAVANKGVTIPDDKLIDEYADYIDQIQTGTNLVVNSNNLDYFCYDRPDFMPVLDDTEVLTYFEYNGTVYNFDIDMRRCFSFDTIMKSNQDPIKLVNKIINLNDKYANINLDLALYGTIYQSNYDQDNVLYIKSAPHTERITMDGTFREIQAYKFKDITIDFTGVDTTYTSYLSVQDIIGGANCSDYGFKIINLPVSILNDDYGYGCEIAGQYYQYLPTLKQFTSDGSELHVNLILEHVTMSRDVFMEFINSLATSTSGNSAAIIISSTLYNELTSDDLAAVAAKNYSLSH